MYRKHDHKYHMESSTFGGEGSHQNIMITFGQSTMKVIGDFIVDVHKNLSVQLCMIKKKLMLSSASQMMALWESTIFFELHLMGLKF